MPRTEDTSDLRQKLTHAEAVIAELRGVVTELRKQIEAQQAHIHRLVKMTFGRRGERVERVAAKRREGKSQRQIAKEEAVSQPRTSATPLIQGRSVEPEGGKVTV